MFLILEIFSGEHLQSLVLARGGLETEAGGEELLLEEEVLQGQGEAGLEVSHHGEVLDHQD